MDFVFTPQEEELAQKVHRFLEQEVTPELEEETLRLGGAYGGILARKIVQKMGANGWLCSSWPKVYGGLDASEMVRFRILDDMAYMGLPHMFIGAHMVGPVIRRQGSDDLKERFLRPIAHGTIELAMGYSEPQAGSDLASLEMRAEDKGDHFIINGQKIFNTHSHLAEYHWLAVRTDRNAPKHRGISIVIADLKSPGITIRPMITIAGYRTNEVFYDDVKVPKENLVGELNRGFYYIMTALDHERAWVCGVGRRLFDDLVEYVKAAEVGGKKLASDPLVRNRIAELAIQREAVNLLYYNIASMLDIGDVPSYLSSIEKVFGSEAGLNLANIGMQILGPYACSQPPDYKWAKLTRRMYHRYNDSIIEKVGAGTNEIQRNIIATRGLGLPSQSQ